MVENVYILNKIIELKLSILKALDTFGRKPFVGHFLEHDGFYIKENSELLYRIYTQKNKSSTQKDIYQYSASAGDKETGEKVDDMGEDAQLRTPIEPPTPPQVDKFDNRFQH